MPALSLGEVACLASVLGPLSHLALWTRLDIDSDSHKLLVLANLIVLLSPFVLYARGLSFFEAISYSFVSQICYAVSLLASIGAYRAFFHPLRAYPGPFWARLSVFWKVKEFKKSDFQAFGVIDGLHRKYGSVVRIGPRQLSVMEPSAPAVIYGIGTECRRLKHLENLRKNLQSLSDPHEHKARRTVWEYGLRAQACQSYLPQINELTNRLCERIASHGSQQVLVNDLCHWYTFDVMGKLGFGRSYGQLETGKAHPAIAKVQNFLKAGVIAIQFIWIINFLQLFPSLEDPMEDLRLWSEQLLEERARTRQSNEKEDGEKDLMSYVYQSRNQVDSKWPMTEKDIQEDAVTLQIAGSDTSYSVLVNSCHFLANYPRLQNILRAEILRTFSESDDNGAAPIWSKLASTQSCPYLDAFINEVLRMFPPVPQGTWRETPATYSIEIEGHVIPPNTIVSCPIWSMHYDERCFREPHSFIPERWLDRSHPDSRADMLVDKRAFMPFLVGAMNCAGKYLAIMEIKVCLAKILNQFEIVLPEVQAINGIPEVQAQRARDENLRKRTKDYLTMWAGDVEVCFRARNTTKS